MDNPIHRGSGCSSWVTEFMVGSGLSGFVWLGGLDRWLVVVWVCVVRLCWFWFWLWQWLGWWLVNWIVVVGCQSSCNLGLLGFGHNGGVGLGCQLLQWWWVVNQAVGCCGCGGSLIGLWWWVMLLVAMVVGCCGCGGLAYGCWYGFRLRWFVMC